MTKAKRGKRPGLRARSKNARTTRKVVARPRLDVDEREELYRLRALAKVAMFFQEVVAGTPDEGSLVLVRLTDGSFRFGMVLKGRFANYEYHNEEFVTFAHPDRITHWMEVVSPVPYSARADEPMTEYAEPPGESIEQAAIAAASEDVYL